MAVRYTTVDGQVLCENRAGVKTLFMPDTLGNVIETRNMETGVQTSSTTYWPYGEVRTQTGTNPSPFGFCGVWGYYTQAGQPTYVRARYYRPNLGRWQTVDPLWPWEDAYGYVEGKALAKVDPSGRQVSDGLNQEINRRFPPSVMPDIGLGRLGDRVNDAIGGAIGGALGFGGSTYVWGVTEAEMRLRGRYRCLSCAKTARYMADKLTGPFLKGEFGDMPANGNTPRNAVGHCTSACYAASLCGFASAREYMDDIYEGVLIIGSDTDRHNNFEGYVCAHKFIGPGPMTPKRCADCCYKKYKEGRLKWH